MTNACILERIHLKRALCARAKVDGTKGPITDGELPKRKEFRQKIAAQLKALLQTNSHSLHKNITIKEDEVNTEHTTVFQIF